MIMLSQYATNIIWQWHLQESVYSTIKNQWEKPVGTEKMAFYLSLVAQMKKEWLLFVRIV